MDKAHFVVLWLIGVSIASAVIVLGWHINTHWHSFMTAVDVFVAHVTTGVGSFFGAIALVSFYAAFILFAIRG